MIFTGDFPPKLQLLTYFKVLAHQFLDEVSKANELMTVNQIELIAILGQQMTMKEVAEALRMHPSNVTGLVNACTKAGWVQRVPSKTDRRTKYLVLTPEGSKIRRHLLTNLSEAVQSISGISDDVALEILEHLKLPVAA